MKRITMLLGAGVLMLCSMVFAAVPQLINFQGVLKDGSGNPVADGSYSVVFTIYDAPSAGTNLWSETQSVTTVNGLFTVLLGSVTPVPAAVFDNPDRWLGIQVGADPEMTPRQRLSSVGYSHNSSEWTSAGQNLFRLSGNVGIGTASPQAPLEIYYDNLLFTAPAIAINNPNGGGQDVIDFRFSGVSQARLRKANGGGLFIGTTGSFTLNLQTNSTNRLTIVENGDVGIGTASPAAKLDVAGGNLNLENSTASAGNILKGGSRFIHNFGTDNTFIGQNAGNLTMTGGGNTGIGLGTLLTNTTGSRNTAIGSGALVLNTTGNDNTAIGFNALEMNSTGRENTAVGYQTLFWNTTGNSNSAHGFRALWANTSGDSNTANGYLALVDNTTGRRNTATGVAALQYNTTGNINTAYGHRALYSNINGTYNTATGADALHSNTTGYDNTANGFWSLYDNTTGIGNTAYGAYALAVNTTGNYNTALGYQAYTTSDNLENATAIGYGAIVDASNKIRLGNAQVTVLECQVGLTVVSDRNQKENFRPVDGEKVLRKIRGFELTSWNYKGHDPKQFRHYGPTAQEFFAAFGEDGVGKIGTETTLNSGDVAGILMVAVQSLEKRTAEVADLKTRMDLLEEKLKEIQAGNPQAKVR
jgi:hypothetical protein